MVCYVFALTFPFRLRACPLGKARPMIIANNSVALPLC